MRALAKYFILLIFLLPSVLLRGQGTAALDTTRVPANYPIPLNRQRIHDLINAEQKAIMASDGKADLDITPTKDDDINFMLTYHVIRKVDIIQYLIETDKQFDHRLKVNYLKGIENMLKYYRLAWRTKSDQKINATELPEILIAYQACVAKDRKGESIETIVDDLPFGAASVIVHAEIFDKNPGIKVSRLALVRKFCGLHPELILSTLKANPDVPFADSLVKTVARKYPRALYDYASGNNRFAGVIQNIRDDKFISSIAFMASSRSGQQYFPFLDNIVNGKLSFQDIDAVKDDSLLYYKLLVKTQVEYVRRAVNKDTAYEMKALAAKLETKAQTVFVNAINGMHNLDVVTRFRIIQPLDAAELYYLAVMSDGIIYTSSFVKGVYPLMMKKINNRGDSLLMMLNFDRYRKLIKMSAGYNTLSHFLSSFPDPEDANGLMRAFVANLEKTDGLEDGVDVADSYASIAETLKPVADEMLRNIQANYKRNLSQKNPEIRRKGLAIYNILNKLFLSADTLNKIDLTKELGIPPVYEVPYTALAYDSGKVAVQLFIYGDRDGIGVFPSLINMFKNANWKVDASNKQWVSISSVTGSPVTLYMNRPLPEENNEDALAQAALCAYLKENKIIPSVTINRGHSYNAPYTIEQMSPASKIVFMGSCGGYRMIHDILEIAPDAHIIGTKQIADAPVNNPFLRLIMEKLRQGSNIDWIPFWIELDKMVTDKIFEDYVPPHKNLGALFIKAFKKAMADERVVVQ